MQLPWVCGCCGNPATVQVLPTDEELEAASEALLATREPEPVVRTAPPDDLCADAVMVGPWQPPMRPLLKYFCLGCARKAGYEVPD